MHYYRNKTTNLALTALVLALALPGCSGGGGDNNDAPMPAPEEMVASLNSLAEYRGEEPRLPTANARTGFNNRLFYIMQRGRNIQDVSDIFTTGGIEAFVDIMNVLKVGVRDWRGITTSV